MKNLKPLLNNMCKIIFTKNLLYAISNSFQPAKMGIVQARSQRCDAPPQIFQQVHF